MARSGARVVDLTIGEHDVATAAPILREMDRAARAGNTGYAPGEGQPTLRDRIARRIEARTGVPTRRSNVIVTAGGQAGLFAAHYAVLDPGDPALYVDPHYPTYPGTIRSVGGRPVALPARAEDGFQPRAADLAATLARVPEARSLLVNSPNNPTGAVYAEAALTELAAEAKAHGLWVISDEVYDTQVWDGTHLSPRALPGMTDCCLVIGSMSKSHAMTGSRIGWICGPDHVIEAISDLVTNTTYGLPGFIQDAADFALSKGPGFEAAIAAPFRRRRLIAQRCLQAQTAVRAAPVHGGMYVLLDIRATGLSGIAFGQALLDETGIAVMAGESFGPAARGHVRVAMTVADDVFEEALSRLLSFAGAKAAAA